MKTSILSVLLILISIAVMLLILAGLACAVVALLMRLSARASGWAALAELYPADGLPACRKETHAANSPSRGGPL